VADKKTESARELRSVLEEIKTILPGIQEALTQIGNTKLTGLNDAEELATRLAKNLNAGADAQTTLTRATNETLDAFKDTVDTGNERQVQLQAVLNLLQNVNKQLKTEGNQGKTNLAQTKETISLLETKIERQLKALNVERKSTKETERATVATKKFDAAQETASKNRVNSLKELQIGAGEIKAAGVGDVATKITTKIIDKLKPILDDVAGVLLEKTADGAEKAASGLKNATDSVQSLYEEASKLTAEIPRMTGQVLLTDVAVRKTGTTMGTFGQRLIRIQEHTAMLGMGLKDVQGAFKELITTSAAYATAFGVSGAVTKAQMQFVDELAQMSLEFKALGLETKTFAGALDVLGKTYRVADVVKETKDFGVELVQIARVTGRTSDLVGQDLANNMGKLAAYQLPKMKEEFKKLSVQAGEAGVKMEDLLEISGKYDDMDTAAKNVGELNALLGGPYLNTIDMVMASDSDRIDMMQKAMKASGQSFDSMGRFMKKAVADVVGGDVQKAMRVFGSDTELIEEKTKAIKTQVGTYDLFVAGAKQSAVGYKEQGDALKESVKLHETAFKEVEEYGREASRLFRTYGSQITDFVGKQVVSALGKFKDMLTEVRVALESKHYARALRILTVKMATIPVDIATDVLADVAAPPTSTPSLSRTQSVKQTRMELDEKDNEIQRLKDAMSLGAGRADTDAPTTAVATATQSPVELKSTHNIHLGDTLIATIVESQLAKGILPWRA